MKTLNRVAMGPLHRGRITNPCDGFIKSRDYLVESGTATYSAMLQVKEASCLTPLDPI